MKERKIRVLLIEDDEDDYTLVRDMLAEISPSKYQLDWIADFDSAMDEMKRSRHDVYLLDYRLGPHTGLELLGKLFEKGNRTPVIFLTGQGDYKIDIEAMEAGAADYLVKGEINAPLLERSIRYAIERRRAEEQLWQAQKIEAIGTLAGGIAHDFNNLLAAIIANTETALFDLPLGSPVRESLEEVVKAGIRGRDLVKQILSFSRKSEKKQKVLKLGPLITETFTFLRSSLPTTIEMDLHLETNSDVIDADPSQIQQILMNLCTNATYAMRGKMGKIEVGLETITLDSKDFLPDKEMSPGDYLVLTVKDTGSGMDEEVRRRIFEPFFTTKSPGEGTGLGLSVVYGIVKSHKGGITVQGEPGKGSVFKVYLPKAQTAVSMQEIAPEPISGGKERILFVDDEEIMIHSVRNMLNRLGYNVTALRNASEALKLFSQDPSQFDLVITDQTMPSMTGEDLAKEMMRIRPDIPIILCTGYSDLITAEKARDVGIQGFILKPFTLREGAELVRSVLDRKGPEQSLKRELGEHL